MIKKIVITIEIGDDEELAHTICQDVVTAATKRRGAAAIKVTEQVTGDQLEHLENLRPGCRIPELEVPVPVPTQDSTTMAKISWRNEPTCKFCGRACASGRSKGTHETRCHQNPNRKIWSKNRTPETTNPGISIEDAGKRMHEIGTAFKNMNGKSEFSDAPLEEGEHISICCEKRVEHGKMTWCTACGNKCHWKKYTRKKKNQAKKQQSKPIPPFDDDDE